MTASCIYSIDLNTNTNETFNISSDNFDHFYVASLDDKGDETNYIRESSNSLKANFFMIRILNSQTIANIIQRLYSKQDIVNISINFTDGSTENIKIPVDRKLKNKKLINSYEEATVIENNLCILITDKKIKYKKNLFE